MSDLFSGFETGEILTLNAAESWFPVVALPVLASHAALPVHYSTDIFADLVIRFKRIALQIFRFQIFGQQPLCMQLLCHLDD